MPADFGVPVVTTLVCFSHLRTRLWVLAEHPAFPAPSHREDVAEITTRALFASRECARAIATLFEILNQHLWSSRRTPGPISTSLCSGRRMLRDGRPHDRFRMGP